MTELACPDGLAAGGRELWEQINAEHELNIMQLVQLTEACRAKDRLDKLDGLLRGDVDSWSRVWSPRGDGEEYELKIDAALSQANTTANLLKQLLAALRLPDEITGKKPQYRGPRGANAPKVPGGAGVVSPIDRLRARAAGSA